MNFSITKPGKYRDIAVLFIVVLGALIYRRPGAFTNPQLWAEDYAIYFLQYEQYGVRSLGMSYGGYLHFLPRIISAFWGLLKINYLYIPVCYSITEFFFTFFIALNIWKAAKYLNIKHRILYAVSFLFLPIGSDIFMNLTNINWIASLYLLNFLFIPDIDESNKSWTFKLIIIFIISFSGPFSTLLSPIVISIFVKERKELSLKKIIQLSTILAGGITQFIYIQFIDRNFYRGVDGTGEPNHLFKVITNNMSELLYFNYGFMGWLSPFAKTVISFLIFLLLVGIFISRYRRINYERKYILLLYAIIVFASYIKAYWPKESLVLLGNPRYYFLPFTCIFWLMVLSLDKKIRYLYIIVYLCYLSRLPYIIMALPDKQWKKQIMEYYQGKRQEIEINPEGWHFSAPPRK